MAVQQNKVSKQRKRNRKGANHYEGMQGNTCPTCGALRRPHCVCAKCGNYGGKQIISVTAE